MRKIVSDWWRVYEFSRKIVGYFLPPMTNLRSATQCAHSSSTCHFLNVSNSFWAFEGSDLNSFPVSGRFKNSL